MTIKGAVPSHFLVESQLTRQPPEFREFRIDEPLLRHSPLGARLLLEAREVGITGIPHGNPFFCAIRYSDVSEADMLKNIDLSRRDIPRMEGAINYNWILTHPDELQPDHMLVQEADNVENIYGSQKNPKYAFIERPLGPDGHRLLDGEYGYTHALGKWVIENMDQIGCETIEAIVYKNEEIGDDMYYALTELKFQEISLASQDVDSKLVRPYRDNSRVAVLMQFSKAQTNQI